MSVTALVELLGEANPHIPDTYGRLLNGLDLEVVATTSTRLDLRKRILLAQRLHQTTSATNPLIGFVVWLLEDKLPNLAVYLRDFTVPELQTYLTPSLKGRLLADVKSKLNIGSSGLQGITRKAQPDIRSGDILKDVTDARLDQIWVTAIVYGFPVQGKMGVSFSLPYLREWYVAYLEKVGYLASYFVDDREARRVYRHGKLMGELLPKQELVELRVRSCFTFGTEEEAREVVSELSPKASWRDTLLGLAVGTCFHFGRIDLFQMLLPKIKRIQELDAALGEGVHESDLGAAGDVTPFLESIMARFPEQGMDLMLGAAPYAEEGASLASQLIKAGNVTAIAWLSGRAPHLPDNLHRRATALGLADMASLVAAVWDGS